MNVGDFLAGDIDVIMSDSGRSAGSDPPGSTSQQGAESNGEMTSSMPICLPLRFISSVPFLFRCVDSVGKTVGLFSPH